MTATAATPRRRLTPEARRRQILDVATSVVSERGFNAVSMQDIATACGLTKAGVQHHFATKTDLLIGLLHRRDRLDAADEEYGRLDSLSREEARAVLDRVVRRNFERRELVRLFTVLSAEALSPDHPAHEYFRARLDRVRRLMATAAGHFHSDPERLALQTIAYLDGLQLLWLRDESVPFLELWDSYADRAFAD